MLDYIHEVDMAGTLEHACVIRNIRSIFDWSLRNSLCSLFTESVKLYYEEGKYFIPDIVVICGKYRKHKDGIRNVPMLVVEVLSPSTALDDMGAKKDMYAQIGVQEYLTVDINRRSVQVYTLKKGVYGAPELFLGGSIPTILPGVSISMEDVFAGIDDLYEED